MAKFVLKRRLYFARSFIFYGK